MEHISGDQWVALTDNGKPWTQRYPAIGLIVRRQLTEIPEGHTWDTKKLVNELFPNPAGEPQTKAKSRLFHIVDVLANHQLADCVFKGAERMLYGRWVTPKAWRRTIFADTTTPSPPPAIPSPPEPETRPPPGPPVAQPKMSLPVMARELRCRIGEGKPSVYQWTALDREVEALLGRWVRELLGIEPDAPEEADEQW